MGAWNRSLGGNRDFGAHFSLTYKRKGTIATGYIVDISKHQKSSAINWPVFSKQVDLLFIRVQYGSSGPDPEYANHTANAVKYGVPFYSYAFPRFISVDDARVEARNAAQRQHPRSLGMVIDVETEYYDGKPSGITKLSKDVRLAGIKAFVGELRAQGVQRVGIYVAHNVYEPWGIDSIVDLFDFVWIPRYGANNGKPDVKPAYPCDLWQYTSVGRVNGYDGNLDLSALTGRKSLEWFVGGASKPEKASPATKPDKPADKPASSSILKRGDRGEAVKALQKQLNAKGFNCGAADGIFGPKTENAVKAFQKAAHIAVDGIVGPQTKAALAKYQKPKAASKKASVPYPGHLIKRGSRGKDVERVQRAVGVKVDGIFGPQTEAAVKAYQKRHGLAADGIVGPKTWAVMF